MSIPVYEYLYNKTVMQTTLVAPQQFLRYNKYIPNRIPNAMHSKIPHTTIHFSYYMTKLL